MAAPKANHNDKLRFEYDILVVFNILKEWQCQKQITTCLEKITITKHFTFRLVQSFLKAQTFDLPLNLLLRQTDVSGYYLPNDKKAFTVMRPNETFSKMVDEM
jgi:hypothetical protein